jgi:hypothetical protein
MASSKRTLDIDELTYQNLYLKSQSTEQISSYTIPVIPGGSNVYKQFQYFTPEQVLSIAGILFTPSTIPDIISSINNLSVNQLTLASGISSVSTAVGINASTTQSTINQYMSSVLISTYNDSYLSLIVSNNILQGQNIQTLALQRNIVTLGNSISTLSSQFIPLFNDFSTTLEITFNQAPSVSSMSTLFTNYYSVISSAVTLVSTNTGISISTTMGQDISTMVGFNNSINDIIQAASGQGVSTLSTLITSTLTGFSNSVANYNPTAGLSNLSTYTDNSLSTLSSYYIIQRGIPGICSISTVMNRAYFSSIVNAQGTAGTPGLCTMSTYLTGIYQSVSTSAGFLKGDTISTFSTSLYTQINTINRAICTVGYTYVILQQEAVSVSLSTLSTSFGNNYNNLTSLSSFSTMLPSVYSTISTVFTLQSPFSTLNTLSTIQGSNISTTNNYISSVYPSIFCGPGLSSFSTFVNPNFSSISTSLTSLFSSFSNYIYTTSSLRTDPGVSSLSSFLTLSMAPYASQYAILNQSIINISQDNSTLFGEYNILSTNDALTYSNLNPADSITALNNTITSFSNYVNTQVAPQVIQTSNVSSFASTSVSRLFSSYIGVESSFFTTLNYLVSSYTSVSTVSEANIYSPTFSTFTTNLITTSNLTINSALYASSIGINTSSTTEYPLSIVGSAKLLLPNQPSTHHILVGIANPNTAFINSNAESTYRTSPSDPGFTVKANDVGYNGKIWVIVGETSPTTNSIKYSVNPASGWTNATIPAGSYSVLCVKWSGTYWLAGTSVNSPNLLISYDGITWTNAAPAIVMDSINGLAWNGLAWVSVGNNSVPPYTNIQYTTPTGVWTAATNSFSGQGNSVTTNGRTWVATGSGTVSMKYSGNASVWTDVGTPQLSTAQTVAWNGDKFLAAGSNGNSSNLMYSYDGIDWTYVPIAETQVSTIQTITWDGSLWNLAGSAGSLQRIMTSPNGISWTTRTIGVTTGKINSIGYASNTTPTIQLSNFDIYSGEIPIIMNSRNRMNIIQSTIYFNDGSLTIRHSDSLNEGNIGINTTYPEYALDIGVGNARKPIGTNWVTASDSRVKRNIETVDLMSCANIISEIPLRTYSFVKEFQEKTGVGSNAQYGFIAQEVKKSLPESIKYTNEYGLNDFHSLDTDQIFKLEFGATKYLLNTIQKLEAQVSTLEARL